MANIQTVGAACSRTTDVQVANNEKNQPISTVYGVAIVTDSRTDADSSSKECSLSQNVKEIKSINDVMQSIKKAQVEEDPSRCYLSIRGNNINNSDHYAFNIIDLLNIHPSAKDLANFNHNARDQYYLALQIIIESSAIIYGISITENSNSYSLKATKDKSLTISCNCLTDFLKIRKNIGKIKKLLPKIQNKEQRDEIKQEKDRLLNNYLLTFHMICSNFAFEIDTIKLKLLPETYYSALLQSLQITITILNQDCDLQKIRTIKESSNIITNILTDSLIDICYTLTTIVLNTNETYKVKALSTISEEKNKQRIKESLDILNNSLRFKLYGTEQLTDRIFLFYNLTNMIFGNNTALNKQIKLLRDNCNIYDSFPKDIYFEIKDIEHISRIYKVILNSSIFSELTPNKIDINAGREFYELMSSIFYIGKYYNGFKSISPDTVYGAEACPKYQEFISLMKIDHQNLTEYSNLLNDMIEILESNTEIKLDNFFAELPQTVFSDLGKMVDDYNKDQSLINKNILIKELRQIIAKLSFINNTDLRIIQDQTNDLKQIKKQHDELEKEELAKIESTKLELSKKSTKKPTKKLTKKPTKKPALNPKKNVVIEYDKIPIKTKTIFENNKDNITKIQELEFITASKNKVEALAANLVSFIYRLEQVQLVKPNDTREEAARINKIKRDINQNKKFNFDTLTTIFEVFNSYEQFNFILEDINDYLQMSTEDKSILQKNDFCKQRAEELKKIILDKQEEYNNIEPQLINIHQLFSTIPKDQHRKYKLSEETVSKCISMKNVFKNVPSYINNIIDFFKKY